MKHVKFYDHKSIVSLILLVIQLGAWLPLYAADLPNFDVHFSVLTKNKQAHKKATLEQLKKEIDILNHYFVTDSGEKIIKFKFKSAHFFDDTKLSNCNFKILGDSTKYFTGEEARRMYYSCNDEKIRDPLAINIYIIDSYSPKYGFENYTTSVGAYNSGNQPYMLLDWARLNHTKLSPEEHEMGHCFGLGHICDPNAKRDTDTNIMASMSQCKGSMGLRNIGFNAKQVEAIVNNAKIIKRNFEKQYDKYKILDVFLKEGGKLYSDLPATNYQYVYIYDNFRILYSKEGINSIVFQDDLNNNEVPDVIENYMLQLVLGKVVLTNIMGFDDPILSTKSLSNKRGAKFIDVKIREVRSRAYATNKNVVDDFNIFRKQGLYSKNVVSITLNRKMGSDNLLLVHELFHTYQNAKTRLRNDWFSEATASLVEKLITVGSNLSAQNYVLPKTKKDLNKLFKSGYSAMPFWQKISYLCNSVGGYPYTLENINKLNFLQTLVSSEQKIWGGFLKLLLNNLEKQTEIATQESGILRGMISKWEWLYSEQKSKNNNKYILSALIDTMNSQCPVGNPELNEFLVLGADYLDIKADGFSNDKTQGLMRTLQKCNKNIVKMDKNGVLYSDYFDTTTKSINLPMLDCSRGRITNADLKGFSIVEHISGNVYFHKNNLSKLHFNSLKTVGGKITLSYNKLKSLDGLENLKSIGNYISLQKNPMLEDVSAIRNLKKSKQVYIDSRKFEKLAPRDSDFCNINTDILVNKVKSKLLICEGEL